MMEVSRVSANRFKIAAGTGDLPGFVGETVIRV
jgi:hypothetical protein